MASNLYMIMSTLADKVYESTGDIVYRNRMEQVTSSMPSNEAKYSNLGMKMGRTNMKNNRHASLRKRKSMIANNQVAPHDPEMQANIDRHGLGDMVVETEEDKHKVMKLIRAIPRPLSVKRSMKDLLMGGSVVLSKTFKMRLKNKWNSLKISWNEFTYSLEVWRSSIKRIEGHQGTGVVSYFVFLRWLFFLNIFIFLLLFWVVTFFQITFENAGYDSDTLGSGSTLYTTTTADTCSGLYSTNVTYETLDLILDFVQGTGWMEKTAMFYGFYTSEELALAVSEYNMPLAYFIASLTVLLVSLIVMVHNTISNFKETVLAKENSRKSNYCNIVFAGMDYSIDEDEAMRMKQKSIYTGIAAELQEQRFDLECKQRTTGEKCKLYTIRFFVNFIIIILLCGAGAAIYYAQDFSAEFTTSSSVNDYNTFVVLLVEFLPSIVIGLLNGIYPLIFGILVQFEGYKPAFVIKISLARTVFLRLASLVMVVTSLYVQVTCSDTNTCLVGQNSCAAIQCWETYVGSAVYKLLIMDLFIDVGVTLGYELPRKVITTKCDCGIAKKVGPAEFDITKNVLDLVYAQMLCWLGFFFSPLIPAVCVGRFFVLFYLKKLSALYNTVPPEKPYQASKSNSFFMVILMVSYFMICIPVGYVLTKMEPSPMCGPFRIYSKPSDIIEVQIANSADWFQALWDIVTSAAVIISLIIILMLAVYYSSALNSAHKELVDMMKEQLVMEGKDKQYLLARIAEMSGQPKKKPPPFNTKPQLKTVDERKVDPNSKGNVSLEPAQLEMVLYGRESSMVPSPVNDNAPPPANYSIPSPQKSELLSNQSGIVSSPNPRSEVNQSALDDW